MTIKAQDLARIRNEASHERAAAEHMRECARRIATGESAADAAWVTATIADLSATLADWRALAVSVEAVPELAEVAGIHASTRRLMAGAIADLSRAAGRVCQ